MNTKHLVVVDSNVILRFLLGDHSNHSVRSRKFFEKAADGDYRILLSEVVIAECVWVLVSYYNLKMVEIDRMLSALVAADYVDCRNKDVVLRALDDTHQLNVDFIDAFLAEFALEEKTRTVATFNKRHFTRFEEIELFDL